jgi:mannitol-1-/sugar-/sorbitol-6-phosphatase
MTQAMSLECAAILFDLDGVLVDSAACIEAILRDWAARHHLDAEHVIAMAHGRRTVETIPMVAPHLSLNEEVAALAESESTTTEGVFEVPGARELLQGLPSDKWAVVTSGIRSVATLRIRHTNLPKPAVLICADEITHGKPHPEGYLTAARRLGVDPRECVVVEDAPPGLEAARAAGMRSIGVVGTYPADALTIATHTIRSFSALRVTPTEHGTLVIRIS